MSTAELKLDLINQITKITEEERLKELIQILNFQSDESIYETILEEKQVVKEAKVQIATGAYFSNNDVQQEVKKWLEK